MRRSGLTIALAVVILAIIAAVYSNSLQCTWQLDDYRCIVDFDYAHTSLPKLWQFSPQRVFGFITFWLNYKACGYAVPGWHVVNIVLHMVNVLVLFGIARWLFKASRTGGDQPRDDRYATFTAAAAAAVFAVHPVQTHTVTYIVQRLEILGTLWAMLAFWCACAAIDARSLGLKLDFWIATAVALALGALSKETIVVAPVLVCTYLVLVRPGAVRTKIIVVVASLCVFAAMTVAALVAFKALRFTPSFSFSMHPFQTLWDNALPIAQYYPTQVRVILSFLRLCVLPYGQRIEYIIEPPSASFLDGSTLVAAGIQFAVIVVAALVARRRPVALFGIVWFYAFLAPSSALPNGMFEHRLYGALAGIILAIAVPLGQELRDQPARARRIMAATCAAMVACLVVCLGMMAHLRNRVWLTEESLWRDAVLKTPTHWRANVNYGKALMATGELATARVYLERAFELEPHVYLVPFNLGVLYHESGEFQKGVHMFEYALSLKRDSVIVSNALGVSYAAVGRIGEATNILASVGTAEAHVVLGQVAEGIGNNAEAADWFSRAVAADPRGIAALHGLERALRACHRTNDAAEVRKRIDAVAPNLVSTNVIAREH